ncbi:MAG: TMEM175 family protein [Acidobacteria bacterium]|nr:TMEM175 family protein [Acidobacteriota bacterium]
MQKNRLEAFSDGVLAIIITIMVLELKVPRGADWSALAALAPIFSGYVLSFLYIGIYWNNHHHLIQSTRQVSAAILWTNLHLLFWLSLLPFATAWVGQNYLAPVPLAIYGVVLLMAALAYFMLQQAIVIQQGPGSVLAAALGADWKGKLSPLAYVAAIPIGFVLPWLAAGLYFGVALLWVVPDRRIERTLRQVGE